MKSCFLHHLLRRVWTLECGKREKKKQIICEGNFYLLLYTTNFLDLWSMDLLRFLETFLKGFRKSKFSHSRECDSPVLSLERFLGSVNQEIENPFSKHTKCTVIFHKRRLNCFGTMQTNFSAGFSGVFAAAPRAPGTASSRS